jgi:xanthine dehydrogenase YagS FAD-binding subunit
MRAFDYERAASVAEIVPQLNTAVRPYAGGTDLLTRLKLDIEQPEKLVDIKQSDLPRGIVETADGISIGALTTLTEIETRPLLAEKYTLLSEAASLAATPQLRNRATVGGNLLQRPRCWYYRNRHVDCWLKGGDDCPAREGHNEHHAIFVSEPCCAVHPSDLAACLLVLEAEVILRGASGERRLLLADFFALPEDGRRQETVIAADELIVSLQIPALPEGTRSTYLKAMDRKVWAFALVGVAAVLRMEGETAVALRLALSGVSPIPWRLSAAEQMLLAGGVTEAMVAETAVAALAEAEPLSRNGYKVPLAQRLLQRALRQLQAS